MTAKNGPGALAAPRALIENDCSTKLVSTHNSHAQSKPQASLDAGGEDDWTFFSARPNVRTRTRCAFPGEFPQQILRQGRGRQAVVVVAVERNSAGEPTTRARGLLFPPGGTA
jgi:hypothetical protein